jgi:enterochelin esterase-like enzyme
MTRWIGGALAGWLAVGLAGLAAYVYGYDAHRGFGATQTPAGVPRGQLRVIAFRSPAIHRTERYLVYLPPAYAREAARGERFPVLYFLHGAPGKMTSLTDVDAAQVTADELIARHRIRPLLLVAPAAVQGLYGDTEWANSPAGRWMDDVVAVVHDVDRRFATLPRRRDRAIAGDSEGAYGAVNVALHHLGLFGVVESWSGYFWQTRSTVFADAPAAQIAANSPAAEVRTLGREIRRLGLRAWIYQGRQDRSDPAQTVHFAADLRRAGAQVRFRFFPGGHDWALWRRETPRMLTAASRWFATPARGAPRRATARSAGASRGARRGRPSRARHGRSHPRSAARAASSPAGSRGASGAAPPRRRTATRSRRRSSSPPGRRRGRAPARAA